MRVPVSQRKRKKWGYYKVLLKGNGWWIKKLVFKGKFTSYQSHKQRDEIWVIYVPAGTKHKLGGKGEVLELALGNPKESDIERFDTCLYTLTQGKRSKVFKRVRAEAVGFC